MLIVVGLPAASFRSSAAADIPRKAPRRGWPEYPRDVRRTSLSRAGCPTRPDRKTDANRNCGCGPADRSGHNGSFIEPRDLREQAIALRPSCSEGNPGSIYRASPIRPSDQGVRGSQRAVESPRQPCQGQRPQGPPPYIQANQYVTALHQWTKAHRPSDRVTQHAPGKTTQKQQKSKNPGSRPAVPTNSAAQPRPTESWTGDLHVDDADINIKVLELSAEGLILFPVDAWGCLYLD